MSLQAPAVFLFILIVLLLMAAVAGASLETFLAIIIFMGTIIAIRTLWDLFVAHRPIKNDKYYDLPILEFKGEVSSCVYHPWSNSFNATPYVITMLNEENDFIEAYITPIKDDEKKHDELAALKSGTEGTLFYRKGKRANYFENFIKAELKEEPPKRNKNHKKNK